MITASGAAADTFFLAAFCFLVGVPRHPLDECKAGTFFRGTINWQGCRTVFVLSRNRFVRFQGFVFGEGELNLTFFLHDYNVILMEHAGVCACSFSFQVWSFFF